MSSRRSFLLLRERSPCNERRTAVFQDSNLRDPVSKSQNTTRPRNSCNVMGINSHTFEPGRIKRVIFARIWISTFHRYWWLFASKAVATRVLPLSCATTLSTRSGHFKKRFLSVYAPPRLLQMIGTENMVLPSQIFFRPSSANYLG